MCLIEFTDVPPSNPFYAYVKCMACRGIISGYQCGQVPAGPCDDQGRPWFRWENDVTRGQIAKMVSNSAGFTEAAGPQIYEDVPPSNTFYVWINRLTNHGHMGGYPCGQTPAGPCVAPQNRPYFRPNASATRGQLSKIASNAAGIQDDPGPQFYQDVEPNNPFYVWINRLTNRGVMGGYPCGDVNPQGGGAEPCVEPGNMPYFRWSNNITRGQTAKIITNTFFPSCQPSR
jgi:hypothetical protein